MELGSTSGDAPASKSTNGRPREGIGVAIAGRWMPGKVLHESSEAAVAAPVFPAETNPSAWPDRTSPTPTAIELSRFWRKASVGFSCIPTD
jgi:hypothetical protein